MKPVKPCAFCDDTKNTCLYIIQLISGVIPVNTTNFSKQMCFYSIHRQVAKSNYRQIT